MSILNKLEVGCNHAPKKFQDRAFAVFMSTLQGKSSLVVKLNLLALIFFAPAAIWYIIVSMSATADSFLIPYSANIGIGFEVVTNAADIGVYRNFIFEMRRWIILTPLLLPASIGLAGLFHSLALLVRGDQTVGAKTFFSGIKRHWMAFFIAIVPILLSLLAFVFAVNLCAVLPPDAVVQKVAAVVGTAVLLIFALSFGVFLCAQKVSYTLAVSSLAKNTFLFSVALLPRSVPMFAFCAIPTLPLFIASGFITSMIIVLYLFVGIALTVHILTVYTQWAFDRYMNPRIADVERANKKSSGEDKKSKKRRLKLQRLKSAGKIVGSGSKPDCGEGEKTR